MFLNCVLGGNRHIIQKTKSVYLFFFAFVAVVPWRPHVTEYRLNVFKHITLCIIIFITFIITIFTITIIRNTILAAFFAGS